MDKKLQSYLKDIEVEDELTIKDSLIKDVRDNLNILFPLDYLEVIRKYNGGEGEIGNESYLKLFPFEELIEINNDYLDLMNEIPDYLLFGKNAADTGYAFHKTAHSYHSFGLMSNFQTDPIIFCGNTFLEFVEYLYNK